MDETAAIRDALAFADAIVDTMRDPLLVLDRDLRVVRAGREFYRTFRVSPEETVGRLVYDLGNRQWDIPRLRELLEDILPRETTFRDFEVEHAFQTIGRRVMLLNARTVYQDPSADPLILLVIEDATARRDAEEARRDAEVRFTEMVKNVRDHSIFLTDPDGVITSWNVAAERVIGYSEAEAVGRSFALIFTPEDVAAGVPDRELRQARDEGRAEDERWHRRKDGTLFWALGIVTPLRRPDGQLSGFSKILRDITDRKRLEEDLRRSHDDLERQVAERTADLTVAHDRALRSERLAVIGQTATTIAHEGRNALQRALGCLAILGFRVADRPEDADLVSRARLALTDQGRLFDDLREYAAPVGLDVRPCDLAEVWREAWAKVAALHPGRDARLEEGPGGADAQCEADAFRLGQVFTNLFGNALDACPDPVRVVVRCREGTVGGRPGLLVTVRDNGPGFTPEQRAKALDPFFTTKATGTGLGLTICRRLVEAHGGTLGLGQDDGPGAAIDLALPRQYKSSEPAASAARELPV